MKRKIEMPKYFMYQFSIQYILTELQKYPGDDLLFSKRVGDYSVEHYKGKGFLRGRTIRKSRNSILKEDEHFRPDNQREIDHFTLVCKQYGLQYSFVDYLEREQKDDPWQKKGEWIKKFGVFFEVFVPALSIQTIKGRLRQEEDQQMNLIKQDDELLRQECSLISSKMLPLQIVSDVSDRLAQSISTRAASSNKRIDGSSVDYLQLEIGENWINLSPSSEDGEFVSFARYSLKPLTSDRDRRCLFVAIRIKLEDILKSKKTTDAVYKAVYGYYKNERYTIVVIYTTPQPTLNEWY